MQLNGLRIFMTGAAGGIGSATAERLAAKGGALALVGRNQDALQSLAGRISAAGGDAHVIVADLLAPGAREAAVVQAERSLGGIDLLLNCAGQTSFRSFADEDPVVLERIMRVNLVVPMLLARRILPQMLARGSGRVVNVGSTFGSIGFAWFAAYSASKFGLRGLSEALRRELEGSGVGVTYVAPRAVKTALNSDSVYRMAEATHMALDEPEWVAQKIIAAIRADAKDVYLGFPESLFARLNGLLPRLMDGGLRKHNRTMEPFARGT